MINQLEIIRKIAEIASEEAKTFDDKKALENSFLYPDFKENKDYKAGERVLYNGILYKVLQNHKSQADWTPDKAPSLFAEVLIPNPNVIPEWKQPESTNPYMKGDKVKYNGMIYQSNIDNNVWAPDVYGWVKID